MKKNKFDLPSEIEKIIKKFNLNENWNKDITQDINIAYIFFQNHIKE